MTARLAPLGGNGKIVEADETYIGRKAGWKPQRGGAHKMKVLSLVERGGKVRSVRMDAITVEDVTPIVRENVARESRLMTDESKVYVPVGREMAGPRGRQPQRRGMGARRGPHEHAGRLLLACSSAA